MLFTWQDVFAGRDTNLPVTVQTELFWNGDFACRYAIPSNSWLFTSGFCFTNFVVGAQHNGGGETYALCETSKLADGLELRWRAFGWLEPGVADHDGDGVPSYVEVMSAGTDPRAEDTDGDGLSDAAETAVGSVTSAVDPDTDGDGLVDGLDPEPSVWNDPDGDADGDGLGYLYEVTNGLDPASADGTLDTDGDGWMDWQERIAGTEADNSSSTPTHADGSSAIFEATFTLASDLPCGTVLTVGDRTLALSRAGSYPLTLREGTAYPVTVRPSSPCTVRLAVTLGSEYAAFQDAGAVFSGGAALKESKVKGQSVAETSDGDRSIWSMRSVSPWNREL